VAKAFAVVVLGIVERSLKRFCIHACFPTLSTFVLKLHTHLQILLPAYQTLGTVLACVLKLDEKGKFFNCATIRNSFAPEPREELYRGYLDKKN
jgi:hypothetical protein